MRAPPAIEFVDADDGALVADLVRERDGRSEMHPLVCLAGVVDEDHAFEALG
jgi:hypothetical protein